MMMIEYGNENPQQLPLQLLHDVNKRIALIGDSTLDNIVWCDGCFENSVAGHLTKLSGCHVTNLAADGFTSADVLYGNTPCISERARILGNDPFINGPYTSGRHFFPIEALKYVNTTKPINAIVLSCGGNDIREILASMFRVYEIVSKFQSNYEAILSRLLEVTPNVIIMMQYRPCHSHDGFSEDEAFYGVYEAMAMLPGEGSPVDKMNNLMKLIYMPILSLARRHGLAVLDLPRTFNIKKRALYRCQIEPSSFGGSIIAELIYHAARSHTAGPGRPSQLYHIDPSQYEAASAKAPFVVRCEENTDLRPWQVVE